MADETTGTSTSAGNTPKQDGSLGALPPAGGSAPLVAAAPPTLSPSPAPAPAPTPRASVTENPAEPDLQSDINKILQGVKLPERRDVPAAKVAPTAPKQYDTGLGVVPEEKKVEVPEHESVSPKEQSSVVGVHTLKNDLQDVVHDQKISRVRAVALEAEKRRPEPIDADMQMKKGPNTALMLGIFVLLVLVGGGATASVYYLSISDSSGAAAQSIDSLIFAEYTKGVALDGVTASTLKSQLFQARSAGGGALGSVTRIVPLFAGPAQNGPAASQRIATFRDFMTALGAHPPDDLLRALSDTYFLGLHVTDQNAPLIIVPITSYDYAFKGMLEWEQNMSADLAPLFTAVSPLIVKSDGSVTARNFSDIVMQNYDVRALKDDSGTIRLYYSFPTRGMLIIAESPYSFPEIISRLQAGRRL